MEDVAASSSTHLCQICNAVPQRYTCPKCTITYCSMNCYKSTSHSNCSEEFYKEWVEAEIKSQSNDPEQKKIMTEILRRVHEQDTNALFNESEEDADGLCDELDSDDDEDVPDLADRIRNVNLDDANELWGILTDAERQEFEALLRNGEEGKLLPEWTPWWSSKSNEKQLIKEIDDQERVEMVGRCPKLLEIPYISAVEKAATTVSFNIINVLYSYVLMVFHYDGDHQNSAKEAVSMFLQLCDSLGSNKIFDNEESALDAVTEKAADHQLLSDEEDNVILDHLKQLIQGPNKTERSFYMLAAISDLHHLFTSAKKELSKAKGKRDNALFIKKFSNRIDEQYLNLSKKSFPLYLKKLEYYFMWIRTYGEQIFDLKNLQLH
ncbi:zinc finger HIT domain-containing protein 2 [Diachasmimorpha longicaudata]|uniref:zinc finger HIT domain-containing protein 2 n=1 Tax=Diachasmimorpha longicaudata TaxID=58733 RepID=UPI0030B8C39A